MSLQACAEILRRGDPDRFAAVMALPPSYRARLFPLFAANVEIARAPWVTAEPLIGEMRLQWWQDALEEIAAGGRVRRHEVTTPLADVLDAAGTREMVRLVQARRLDCARQPFAGPEALQDYVTETAGALAVAAARVLGQSQAAEPIRRAGAAAGMASFLQSVPRLRAAGWPPFAAGGDVDWGALARRALDDLDAAMRQVPGTARPALLTGWMARWILRRAIADPGRVEAGRLLPSEFRRRAGLIGARAGLSVPELE